MKKRDFSIIRISSLLLCLLVGFTSLLGLSETRFYEQETFSWQIQTTAQDFVNLMLALPVLGAAVIMMNRGNHNGYALAGGVIAYLGYTYVIYCFNVHFNALFLAYCAILGVCAFGLLAVYRISLQRPHDTTGNRKFNMVIAVYFILVSVFFFGLWLWELIPATLVNTPPHAVGDAGLFTNPIHVLDLALLLPFIFLTGLSLLFKSRQAAFLVPVVLVFMALMNASIGTLNIIMGRNGLNNNQGVTVVMYVLTLLSLGLLLGHTILQSKKNQ